MIANFIHITIMMTTPILLAALGGAFTDLGGTLNIGLEGMMLSSAFFAAIVANFTSSIFLGIMCGIISSIGLAALMAILSLKFGANVFITGLATNLLSSGLTIFLSSKIFNSKGTIILDRIPQLVTFKIPLINEIPFIGKIFSGFTIFEYMGMLLVLFCYILIYKTPYGIHQRTVGLYKKAAESLGISAFRHRFIAFLISGFFCGLGGAYLSLSQKAFVGGMTNGRGWIALVAVILGRGNPVGIMFSSLLFGLATSLSNILQTTTQVSSKLLFTLPFVITLLTMILDSVRRKDYYEK
jgi:ABC-type uncharacterized transport system permease subunit